MFPDLVKPQHTKASRWAPMMYLCITIWESIIIIRVCVFRSLMVGFNKRSTRCEQSCKAPAHSSLLYHRPESPVLTTHEMSPYMLVWCKTKGDFQNSQNKCIVRICWRQSVNTSHQDANPTKYQVKGVTLTRRVSVTVNCWCLLNTGFEDGG